MTRDEGATAGGGAWDAGRADVEALYEHAPCGLVSTLPDGTIARVNETLLGWTGYRREELVGRRRFQELLTPGGRIYHETHYAPLLRMQGWVREIALELRLPDRATLPVLVSATLHAGAGGEPLRVDICLFSATDRRRYESELLQARRAAEESEERARLLAQTLQASLIPPEPPTVPGLDVAALYRPAGDGTEVGGDFYDVFETGRGEWAIVLGDVRGKGAEAARVTALARYTVRAAAMRTRRPSGVLGMLNEALLRDETDRFCTAVYARIHRLSGSECVLTVASGGHPLPLRVGAGGDDADLGRPGQLLGVLDDVETADVTERLEPGDVVVFYSDGVTEARRDGGLYGEAALRERVRRSRRQDAAGIARELLDEVMAAQHGVARDDIAVVVLKVPGPTM